MLNIKPYKFIQEDFKFISEEKYQSLRRHNVLCLDVLLSKVGAGIGESAIVPNNFRYGLLSTTGLAGFRVGQIVYPELLCYFINYYRSRFIEIASTTAQPFLNMKTIKEILFPLPPINEQKRIVEKVNELMKLCDELESQLAQSKQESEKLMQAVLQEAFQDAM